MPHGRGIRAYMDVFTACLRRQVPIHVSDGINIASSRQCKGCRQLSKVNGTAVNKVLYIQHLDRSRDDSTDFFRMIQTISLD